MQAASDPIGSSAFTVVMSLMLLVLSLLLSMIELIPPPLKERDMELAYAVVSGIVLAVAIIGVVGFYVTGYLDKKYGTEKKLPPSCKW